MRRIPAIVWGVLSFFLISGGVLIGAQFVSEAWIIRFDRAGILLGYALSCLSIGVAAYAWAKRAAIRRWFQQKSYEDAFEPVKPQNVKGVVIPVSRREQPEWILRHLRPEKAVLLYTSKTIKVAKELYDAFQNEIEILPEVLNSPEKAQPPIEVPFNPEAAFEAAKRFIQRLEAEGLKKHEIYVDTTGGTVPMSIGCFMAAEKAGVSSIYVIGMQQGKIKDPVDSKQGKPIFISNHSEAYSHSDA